MYISKLASVSEANVLQTLEEKRTEAVAHGADIINLSVGTPDRPPADHVMQAVCEASKNPLNYKYTLSIPPRFWTPCSTGIKHVTALTWQEAG
jgi:LL-diaminopimelate aminotransferase